jgi:site-specific recombinase XerD
LCRRRHNHDQRHAHASWLLAGGSDLASVMDRLGHAHIQTTEKYLHAPADADQKNLSALARIRNNTPAPPPEPAGE